ncbi:MAG TPA: sterol desaturase family protein [Fimbriimonas sp.]|nr:sterol desaturase family protein [Fimbriimonas sp.]
MNLPELTRLSLGVFASGLIFVAISALIFWPLEELLEGGKAERPKFKDLAYLWFYQSYGLWIGAGMIFEIAFLLRGWLPASWSAFVQHQPFWLQVVVALLMAEVWVYSVHRLAHRWEFLWQFHRVHHTLVDMTWSAAARQHPVDFFLTIVGANLPAMILGINLESIALFILFERLYTVMLHSNLNLDWGWFSKIVSSPNVHRLHHSPTCRANYAGILSLLDVVAKTYQSPAPRDGAGRE